MADSRGFQSNLEFPWCGSPAPATASNDRMKQAMEQQYGRRKRADFANSSLAPHYVPVRQDLERRFHACIAEYCARVGVSRSTWKAALERLRVLDVGCGSGGWLSYLASIGLAPENLVGVEILEERAEYAREHLPASCRVESGNFLDHRGRGYDLLLFFTVFSSVLVPAQRAAIAEHALACTAPGGAVIVFDFAYDNPRNPDVRKVTKAEMTRLFPGCELRERSALVAPPLARAACRISPRLYALLDVAPLRTHRFWTVLKP